MPLTMEGSQPLANHAVVSYVCDMDFIHNRLWPIGLIYDKLRASVLFTGWLHL